MNTPPVKLGELAQGEWSQHQFIKWARKSPRAKKIWISYFFNIAVFVLIMFRVGSSNADAPLWLVPAFYFLIIGTGVFYSHLLCVAFASDFIRSKAAGAPGPVRAAFAWQLEELGKTKARSIYDYVMVVATVVAALAGVIALFLKP